MASEGVCWGRSFGWSLELVKTSSAGDRAVPYVGTCSAGGTPPLQPAVMSGCATPQPGSPGDVPLGWGLSCPPGSIPASPFCCGSLAAPRGSVCSGLLGARRGGPTRGSVGTARSFRAQSSACWPPHPLPPQSWARGLATHNGAVCASVWGLPPGEMLFFPGGQRGWVCEGRQGRAGTQPRSVPRHRSTTRCSPARADVSPLAPGASRALPGARRHRGMRRGCGPRPDAWELRGDDAGTAPSLPRWKEGRSVSRFGTF